MDNDRNSARYLMINSYFILNLRELAVTKGM